MKKISASSFPSFSGSQNLVHRPVTSISTGNVLAMQMMSPHCSLNWIWNPEGWDSSICDLTSPPVVLINVQIHSKIMDFQPITYLEHNYVREINKTKFYVNLKRLNSRAKGISGYELHKIHIWRNIKEKSDWKWREPEIAHHVWNSIFLTVMYTLNLRTLLSMC